MIWADCFVMEMRQHKKVSEIPFLAVLIITVRQKILACLTASFLVIRDATIVNLSNNLAMSNEWIVFAFKRRFSRLCKKKNKNETKSDYYC